MITLRKSFVAASLFTALAAAGCDADDPEFEEIELEEAVGGKADGLGTPIELLFARTVSRCDVIGAPGCTRWAVKTEGYVEVENIALEKNIIVHYGEAFDPWSETSGTYVGPASETSEYWHFETAERFVNPPGGVTLSFAVSYDVAGQTFWENNDGTDFCLSWNNGPCNASLLGTSALAVQEASAVQGSFFVHALVKNLAYEKDIRLVYSVDDWATVNEASVDFAYPRSAEEEMWIAAVDIPGWAEEVKFALAYTVSGHTFWDNNLGRDYTVNVPGNLED